MKYRIFYDKFTEKECLYREDIYVALTNNLDFNEEEASLICRYLYENDFDKTDVMFMLNKKLGKESRYFTIFLNILKNKLIVNKTITNAIENAYVQLITELTVLTGGYVIYKTQLDTIIQTIGRTFMWSDFKYDKLDSDTIRDYICENMVEYSTQYPVLTKTLVDSIDELGIEGDYDYFKECSNRHNLVINLKRNELKNKQCN